MSASLRLLDEMIRGATEAADAPNGLAAADWVESKGDWPGVGRLLAGLVSVLMMLGDRRGSPNRLGRCEEHIEDEDLLARLRLGQFPHLMLLADWAGYVQVLPRLANPTEPYATASASINLALTVARHDLDRARSSFSASASPAPSRS